MNEIPFNMFGYPIGPSYLPAEPTNVGISQLELDREYSHSRQREAYLEAHRIIVEESYNRMGERMRNDKQGRLVDIYV